MMRSSIVRRARATFKLLGFILFFPFAVIRQYRYNRSYQKYLEETFKRGKNLFDADLPHFLSFPRQYVVKEGDFYKLKS